MSKIKRKKTYCPEIVGIPPVKLTTRAWNCLYNGNFFWDGENNNIFDPTKLTWRNLMITKNMGFKTAKEIAKEFSKFGIIISVPRKQPVKYKCTNLSNHRKIQTNFEDTLAEIAFNTELNIDALRALAKNQITHPLERMELKNDHQEHTST